MTIDADWAEEGYDAQEQNEEGNEQVANEGSGPVVPVRIVFNENEPLSPTFCSCMTYTVIQVGTAGVIANQLQILPRRLKRYKAKFIVNFPGAGILYFNTRADSLTNPTPQGFTVSPSAATVITPAVPGNGVAFQNPYPFPVQVVISGGTVTQVTVNGTIAGGGDGTYVLPVGGIIAITYSVAPTWAWSPLLGPTILTIPDYDSMQPLYAISNIAGVTISVWDESFGNVASGA